MACRSRASSRSIYIGYAYSTVSLLSHSLLPGRCSPVVWTLSLSMLTSQADPLTLRNRIRLRIRLRIIITAPRIFGTHGSAAASAKRTEIRRPHRGSRRVRPRLKIPADICNPLMKSEFRSPAALADPSALHRLSTHFPLNFLPPSFVFCNRWSLGGAQNSNSGRIQAQILETLCK